MPASRFFAGFLGLLLLSGPVMAQPPSGLAPAPKPSTDPALSPQANATFLKENAKKPGVNTTRNGVQYKIIRNGYGKHPAAVDSVEVYYTGSLINGEVFDGTSPGLPASFNVTTSGLVQGWVEILQMMREGDHWQVWIPSTLGYGSRGPGTIPPHPTPMFGLRVLRPPAPPQRGRPGFVSQTRGGGRGERS